MMRPAIHALPVAALALLAPVQAAAEPSTTSIEIDGIVYGFDVVQTGDLIEHEGEQIYWVIMPNMTTTGSVARVRLAEMSLAPKDEDGDPWACIGARCLGNETGFFSVEPGEFVALSTDRPVMSLGLELDGPTGPVLLDAFTELFPGCPSEDSVLEGFFAFPNGGNWWPAPLAGVALLTLQPSAAVEQELQCLR